MAKSKSKSGSKSKLKKSKRASKKSSKKSLKKSKSKLGKGDDGKTLQVQIEQLEKEKQECEAEILKLTPPLKTRQDLNLAVEQITPEDLAKLASMKNPSETVKMVLAAVLQFFGLKSHAKTGRENDGKAELDLYWEAAQKLLSDGSEFMCHLLNTDPSQLPKEMWQEIRMKYWSHRHFHPERLSTNPLVQSLCQFMWDVEEAEAQRPPKQVIPLQYKVKMIERELTQLKNKHAKLEREKEEKGSKAGKGKSKSKSKTNVKRKKGKSGAATPKKKKKGNKAK